MKLIKNSLKTLKESFVLAKNNLLYVFWPVLLDLLFLLTAGFSGNLILSKAFPFLEKFAELNVNAPSVSSMTDSEFSAFISQSAEKTSLANQAFNIFIQFIIVLFVLWLIFQGINWFLAAKCVKDKVDFKKYMLNFSAISLLGFLSSCAAAFLIMSLSVKNILSQNLANMFFTNIITVVLFAVILYFLFVGYASSHKHNLKEFLKNVFVLGIKDFKNIIFAYLMLIILFCIIDYMLNLLFAVNSSIALIAGVFILMPLIALSRIYLIKNLENK